MLIICPRCTASYTVDSARLPPGREVRCGRCRAAWQAPEPVHAWSDDVFAPFPAFGEAERPAHHADAPLIDLPAAEDAAPDAGPADPVTMAESPPLVPGAEDAADEDVLDSLPDSLPDPAPETRHVEAVAQRRNARPARRIRGRAGALGRTGGAVLLLAALAAANAALVVWRGEIAQHLPQTASLYAAIGLPVNLRGVTFTDVRTTTELHDGQPLVAVEGVITNVSRRPVEVPRLRFAVRDEGARELHAWTSLPARTVLPAGETLPFRTHLTAPPAAGTSIAVRFLTPADLVGGMP